ncbi:hypothetical protein [Mycobacterium marinum]|uniref:hypothetical protein n=1 Tax=Mycobacterium marinum TaxID=1781 RepID=UPI002359E18C|nr:hypothetical protein [Mycobacterium marinum]MDC8973985.1 hypothetical protein [Mycobacterium marinum]
MTNQHGCRFIWCENPATASEAQRLEHFQTPEYVPTTGDPLKGFGQNGRRPDHEDLPTVGVGVRFNEDLEPAPTIYLDIQGRDCVLRIDQAVLLYNALGSSIVNACKGTNLSPKRITTFYGGSA